MNNRQLLRELLRTEKPLVMPDAYDGLSARLIQIAGFKAVQCSGYSMGLSSRAAPEQAVDLDKNLDSTRDIVQAVTIPVMADGEDGFGPPSTVYNTVGAFLDVGVSGINLEDQILPPSKGKGVIDLALMIEKMQAAREAAKSKEAGDMIINARTDALAVSTDRAKGIDEAILRGNKYLQAGADLIFIPTVSTPDEAKRLVDGIQGPVSIAAGMPYNIKLLSIGQLRALGVARVSLPAIVVFSTIQAIKKTLSIIHDNDNFEEIIKEASFVLLRICRKCCPDKGLIIMKIECYLSPECASEAALRKNIDVALAIEKVKAEVIFKRIDDETAVSLGLSGSPSIFINGNELQPQGTAGFS